MTKSALNKQASIEELNRLINEGLASGIGTRTVDEIWDEACRLAKKKRAQRC